MLRIYGVTFDHTINYGSSLQAFALGKVLTKMRIGPEECDYKLLGIMRMPDGPKSKPGRRRPLKIRILCWLKDRQISLIYLLRFSRFEKRHIPFADVKFYRDLPKLNETVDAFICGSDVIWGDVYTNDCNVYYLDFARKYKFAYAPSFGKLKDVVIPENKAALIGRLDDISCREESGCDVVEQITRKRPVTTIDPVFLLSAGEWEEIALESRRHIPKHYIFVYRTYDHPILRSVIASLHEQTSLPVITTLWQKRIQLRTGLSGRPTPPEWVRLIRHADYVITNSFHGTAFAILFHKKFYSVTPGGAERGTNIRITDILEQMGLADRMICEETDPVGTGDINFDRADKKLEELKKESLDYLRRNLERAYERKMAAQGTGHK